MGTLPFEAWGSDLTVGAGLKVPTAPQQAAGFVCGAADPEIFNQLFKWLTEGVIDNCQRIDSLFTDDITDDALVAQLNAQLQVAQTDITNLQTLASSNESRVSAAESAISSNTTSIGGLTATVTNHGSRLNALEALNFWTSDNDGDGSGLDADLLGGIANDQFYHAGKANTSFRMGTNTATNYDGVVYDESGNTFTFKADADLAGLDTGNSILLANRFRANADLAVGFGTTTSVTFKNDELTWVGSVVNPGGGAASGTGTIKYQDILSSDGEVRRFEGINVPVTGGADPNDSITSIFNGGGGGVQVFEVARVEAYRIQDLVHVNMRIVIDNYFFTADDDQTVSVTFNNYEKFFSDNGFFTAINRTTHGHVTARFSGSGFDLPDISMKLVVGATDLTFSNLDRRFFDQSGALVTDATYDITFTARVSG